MCRAPAQKQQQPRLPELPQEVVVSILQAMPLQARLQAALVCKAWAKSATLITTHAEAELRPRACQHFEHWLKSHGLKL
jgi:hypothetical protein